MRVETAVRWGAAAAVVATVASQHPNPAFNAIKSKDTLSVLIPNWRFFAPEPAQHDYDVYYRVRAGGRDSEWLQVHAITPRRVAQLWWFPQRRAEKGLFDMVSELITSMSSGIDVVMRGTPYRMLREVIRHRVVAEHPDADELQFSIVRHGGYDEQVPVEVVFVSPGTPVKEAA